MELHNDVRSACLDRSINAVAVTDLAGYYPHIEVDGLLSTLCSLIGDALTEVDQSVLHLLGDFLLHWSTNRYGMPQNLDPSSFFGAIYLTRLDEAMANRRFRMFRWVDDMRIVAQNRDQAIRALQVLEKECETRNLFLNAAKTYIIERGSAEFDQLLDVEDDIVLSKIDEFLQNPTEANVDEAFLLTRDGYKRHREECGNEKKYRAFANKLLDIAAFPNRQEDVGNLLRLDLIKRLRRSPGRSAEWVKMLGNIPHPDFNNALLDLTVTKPSIFDSHRMWCWRALASVPDRPSKPVLERAKELAQSTLADSVSAQVILLLGRHGTNADTEFICDSCFSLHRSYLVQRAIIVACQTLPQLTRTRFYDRVRRDTPEHNELIEFILSRSDPLEIQMRTRPTRSYVTEARPVEPRPSRGIGVVAGQVCRFPLARYGFATVSE